MSAVVPLVVEVAQIGVEKVEMVVKSVAQPEAQAQVLVVELKVGLVVEQVREEFL